MTGMAGLDKVAPSLDFAIYSNQIFEMDPAYTKMQPHTKVNMLLIFILFLCMDVRKVFLIPLFAPEQGTKMSNKLVG